MFDSPEDLSAKLSATGYFIDPVMTKVVFLAAKLQKPLILEGPAGSGKTQLALAVAQAANTHIERLQCYEGLTDKQAIGEFDEGLQRLYIEFCKGQGLGWQEIVQSLKGRDFFRPGPLMRALECERPCVLLIDELDKVEVAKEALLLEPLSSYQLSIPEFGTVDAKSIPFAVITSNEERRLGDPIRRRSLYIRVEHPTPEREAEIIASRTPEASPQFHREMAGIALAFRNYSLEKPPFVSEMIDFANALRLMSTEHVTPELRDVLLWVPLNRYGEPLSKPTLPDWALPPGFGASRPSPDARGPLDQHLTAKIESFRELLGDSIYTEILIRSGHSQQAGLIPNATLQKNALEWMESASRGFARARALAETLGEAKFMAVIDGMNIASMVDISSLETLRLLVDTLAGSVRQDAA